MPILVKVTTNYLWFLYLNSNLQGLVVIWQEGEGVWEICINLEHSDDSDTNTNVYKNTAQNCVSVSWSSL
jgi:hypothetical protein